VDNDGKRDTFREKEEEKESPHHNERGLVEVHFEEKPKRSAATSGELDKGQLMIERSTLISMKGESLSGGKGPLWWYLFRNTKKETHLSRKRTKCIGKAGGGKRKPASMSQSSMQVSKDAPERERNPDARKGD